MKHSNHGFIRFIGTMLIVLGCILTVTMFIGSITYNSWDSTLFSYRIAGIVLSFVCGFALCGLGAIVILLSDIEQNTKQ